MNIEIRKSTWIAVLGVLALITLVSSIAVPTLALKNYFNCTTKVGQQKWEIFRGGRKYLLLQGFCRG